MREQVIRYGQVDSDASDWEILNIFFLKKSVCIVCVEWYSGEGCIHQASTVLWLSELQVQGVTEHLPYNCNVCPFSVDVSINH